MNKKIPGLDLLRALAITMVFLFHYRLFPHPAWVDTIGSFGWTGVDLFFVLSGYLIASQVFYKVAHSNFSLREFFLKRFFRILPAYWVVVTLYFIIPWFREWGDLPPLWKFVTFTQNFGLDLRYQRTFSHAWSLCVEEQYYLLFPLTVMAWRYLKLNKLAVWLVAALVLLGILLRISSWNTFIVPIAGTDDFGFIWYKWIYYPTYNRLDGLLAGISIAALFQYYPAVKQFAVKQRNIILLSGLVLSVCAYMLCIEPYTFSASVWSFPLIACAYGLVVASAVCGADNYPVLIRYITARLATLSYSIYLVHKATIHLTQMQAEKLNLPTDSSLMFMLCIVTSVSGALLLHYVIEKPFLLLRDKLMQKKALHYAAQ